MTVGDIIKFRMYMGPKRQWIIVTGVVERITDQNICIVKDSYGITRQVEYIDGVYYEVRGVKGEKVIAHQKVYPTIRYRKV